MKRPCRSTFRPPPGRGSLVSSCAALGCAASDTVTEPLPNAPGGAAPSWPVCGSRYIRIAALDWLADASSAALVVAAENTAMATAHAMTHALVARDDGLGRVYIL